MFGKLFSKISGFFFLELSKLIVPRFKELTKILVFTEIEEDVQTYLSNILFISFIIGIILEFLMIFVMLKLNILFTIFTFILTIIISFTFAGFVFMILYKYPYYVINANKKELENELEISVKHLSVLQDPSLTVKDVLLLLQKIEKNKLLTEESKKILSLADLNKNLKETLKSVCNNTYSEQEYSFFSKLIEVLDKKADLFVVINDYLLSTEQIRKEKEEHQRNKITLLFEINVFLFFLIFILIFSVFLMPFYRDSIKNILFIIAIIFPIIELILIFILNK
ncbi:MAG: type II secretion system F family protein [archaeon]|jgi:archaellum biogenesis protein FlaJ (TadC family)